MSVMGGPPKGSTFKHQRAHDDDADLAIPLSWLFAFIFLPLFRWLFAPESISQSNTSPYYQISHCTHGFVERACVARFLSGLAFAV